MLISGLWVAVDQGQDGRVGSQIGSVAVDFGARRCFGDVVFETFRGEELLCFLGGGHDEVQEVMLGGRVVRRSRILYTETFLLYDLRRYDLVSLGLRFLVGTAHRALYVEN